MGGTALSLQIGHRESIDIDLFSDAEYGAIDFRANCLIGKDFFLCRLFENGTSNWKVIFYRRKS
ncbi:nucleotidyl transferase AbiEii/AbiGii toxin family protein [Salegentibacter sp. Hel_I_6]|uniref:nucleotidyl transferase AbiEii/AbiGii toxin family protein n=1 Tax=Salegentibacter sp. Hel_I_6 TaxID=1250278 RepID=UPI0018CDA7A9